MAAVKISRDLKHCIQTAAYKPFNERFIEATKLTPDESNQVYRKFFISEEQQAHLEAVPKDFISLSVTNSKISMFVKDKNSFAWFELQPTVTPIYNSYCWTSSPSGGINPEESNRYSWPEFDTSQLFFLQERHAKLKAIIDEREAFYAPIRKMLEKCATLNQVEKLWPAIRKYVPQEYLERLDSKTNRKTAQSIGIDTDELQSLNLAHIKQQMVV